MKNLEVLTREQVDPQTQAIFNGLEQKVGMVPNLYGATANSHYALKALLDLGETLKKGNLNAQEVEAVALAVGESNQCNYCLSAHTALGKMVGFSEQQTLDIRNGGIEDPKIKALTDLAKEITKRRGHPGAGTLEAFFQAGYSKGALVDVIGLVALNTFTNYVNHIAATPIDFPLAPRHHAVA